MTVVDLERETLELLGSSFGPGAQKWAKALGDSVNAAATVPDNLYARPPKHTDDLTRGFRVDDFWTSLATPYYWRATSLDAGRAAWRAIHPVPVYPGDLIPLTNARALYGLIKLVRAYTGSCVRIVRASDSTTLDVGFVFRVLPNGLLCEVVDEAAIATFIAGTTGTVDIWYDQSGLANHALQTTAAARPQWGFNRAGWHPTLTFSTFQSNATQQRWLAVSSGATISIDRRDCSLFVAGRNRGSLIQSCWGVTFPGGVATQQNRFMAGMGVAGGDYPSMGVSNEYANFLAPSDDCILGWVMAAGPTTTIHANGRKIDRSTALVAATGNGWQVGTSGAQSTTNHSDMVAWMLWDEAITATQQDDLKALLSLFTGIPLQQPKNRIVLLGDSMTIGTGTTLNRNAPFYEKALYESPVQYVNCGVGGRQMAQDLAALDLTTAAVYDETIPRTIFMLRSNGSDILASRSGAAVWADTLAALEKLRRLPGAAEHVAVIGTTTSISSQPTTEQLAQGAIFRALVLQNRDLFDGVFDFGSDPQMGFGSELDATKTLDGTHPTALAYSYLAPRFAELISPLLAA